ncbi:hypothetical protein J6590_007640 [Homalodisca vitripennis]|nr:hypothetical protein J6590_007640 [Homalodisca vitripennis]
MGGGWAAACLLLAVAAVTGEDRWSRPATPERRQGDWVPLTCANCRPLADQSVQASNSLPSVLTPPPRVEEARLLPPPPPPDPLFQQAATGFLQAYTQQQSAHRNPHHQFLQETTSQTVNRPQAQFLKSNNIPASTKPSQSFLQEPSADFQPPQQPQQPNNQQSTRQSHLLQFNQQQFIPESGPYLNQPLFLGPQIIAAAPFFPQSGIPPQNIQPINPIQIQPQAPITPNTLPVNKQNFQLPVDRPTFIQQITAAAQEPTSVPQQAVTQTTAPQLQYTLNNTSSQNNEGEGEEIQLLYVPVETLNHRARNLGKSKSLPHNQHNVVNQQLQGADSNRFTSPGQSFDFTTRKPHLEDHENFNTQTSKQQYKSKQNFQHQQQFPPEDQEKYNTQTHSVRQQFNINPQGDQFQQQAQNFKLEGQNIKQQYNFKTDDHFQIQAQQDQVNPSLKFNNQHNDHFLQQQIRQDIANTHSQIHNTRQHNVKLNDHNQDQIQQDQASFSVQNNFNANDHLNAQQNINIQQQQPQVEQTNFNTRPQTNQQHLHGNHQFQQQQVNQQASRTVKEQPYVNQPLKLDEHLGTGQGQIQQHFSTQQTQLQQQFDLPEVNHQTVAPVTQTRVPDALTTQHITSQNYRNQQQDVTRNVQQNSNDAFTTQLTASQNYRNPQQGVTRNVQQNSNDALTTQHITSQSYRNPQQDVIRNVQHNSNGALTTQHAASQNFRNSQHDVTRNVHLNSNDASTTQHIAGHNYRNPQQDVTRNVQHNSNAQFTRKFPQDYQSAVTTSQPPSPENVNVPAHSVTQNQQPSWSNQNQLNQEQHFNQQQLQQFQENINLNQQVLKEDTQFHPEHDHISSVSSLPSTLPSLQTTPAPNQPPLSVYMETTENNKVNDVLRLLKNAKTIQVLDTVGPESPQVFVGPSNLKAPAGYIKFELPYLNSLESNRVERKVDKLPFFVAPLNFNPPPGYSKIPFPAPHIGSVVVSNVTVLKTALHEKPYENDQVVISSTERYLDQFTLPAEIPPISPQLPSLINSLRDEVFTGSSTTALPSTTTEPAAVFTTQAYRGRGPSRGSHRATSNYQTSASPTRRQHSRTRRPYDGRPYSRRQPITTTTTTTTTEEPSTEAFVQPFTTQPEQLAYNSNDYIQNTAAPINLQTGNGQSNFQSKTGEYFDERFVANNYNQDHSVSQQQVTQSVQNQNIPTPTINNFQGSEQYQQHSEIPHNRYTGESVGQTTVLPTVSVPDVQTEEHTFKSQRTNDIRRDPLRQHQRFRGRQRITTTSTTTESYEEPVQPIENKFSQQGGHRLNYQNLPSRQTLRNNNHHRLVENTHFEANAPLNKFAVQTERADVNFQTTERLIPSQKDQYIQQNVNEDRFSTQINTGSRFEQPPQISDPTIQQVGLQQQQVTQAQFDTNPEQSNFNANYSQNGFDFVSTPQQNTQTQYTTNEFQQINVQKDTPHQADNFHEAQPKIQQVNSEKNRPISLSPVQSQQNYFDQIQQQRQSTIQEQVPSINQQQFSREQSFQHSQENIREPSNINHNLQGQHVSTTGHFEQVTEIAAPAYQATAVQVEDGSQSKVEEDPRVQQYNQQHFVKYNRVVGKTPENVNFAPAEEQTVNTRRGQNQYQINIDSSDVSTTEAAVTRASLVRVRGRVRNRQRGSTRNYQTTTTEAPNYPTTYLSRQRNHPEKEENQDYNSRKRINYGVRPTSGSFRNSNFNREVNRDQSVTEANYAITEKQLTPDGFVEYPEVSTTTTTTETPSTKPSRRYQHILNRNKLRRTRPTNSPVSSGTTKFLQPTTSPPVTRLPSSRARIRKPGTTTTTTSTTEYPQVNPSWNERDNFAPSAGSNEILEPLYQTRDKQQPSFGFQRAPILQKQRPQPASSDDDEFWNQAVTIQQSTSFDFKPDPSAVTPPSFQANTGEAQGTFAPIWDGQIELQDGNYYDVFHQKQIEKNINDQTPFSSDQQKVVYKEIKSRRPIGKENQYTEKTYEIRRPSVSDEEDIPQNERVYPVYREIIKPAETIQDEITQTVVDAYGVEGKYLHEKDINESSEQQIKNIQNEETPNVEGESQQPKVGALKRKIIATNTGKKGGRRRGSWVRVRVRKPQDMFETAESQNLASLSENAIQGATKATNDKGTGSWSTESTTEVQSSTEAQTTTEAVSEPAETINFEEALKDMLKEFITNPEEDNKEEVDTEGNTDSAVNWATDVSTSSEEPKEEEPKEEEPEVTNLGEKQNVDVTTLGEAEQEKTTKEDAKQEERVRTVLPEVTTEIFTQEPTTIFQTIENVETTLEPDVTTSPNEHVYQQHSRVLGTSTTTEISLETEICYRGRCVKTKKVDGESDLLTTE